MNLPARGEGDHLCIGHLVREEATRMVAASPSTAGVQKHIPDEVRISRLEDQLWGWLRNGWTRLRDDGVLVHWHPDAEDWVPFTKELHQYYVREGNNIIAWFKHREDQAATPPMVPGSAVVN